MAGTKLLPCPFCGGKAHIWNSGYFYSGKCYKCGCTLSGSGYVTEAEAIAAWNTRADDYRQAAEYWQRMYEEAFAERTCRMELTDISSGSAYHDVWLCCACGEQVEQHTVMGKSEPPSYCPNCGARVTPKNSETTPKVVSE